jgi:hypothetical protein
VTLQGESDHRDSDSDANDEGEEDRDITLRSGRKFLYKRTSCAAVDDLEEEEAIMFNAAIKTSIRDTMNGGGLTSAGSTGDIRATLAPTAVVHRFVVGNGFEVDSNVVPDSDLEGEVLVLTESEDGTIVQRRTDPGKDRCRDERQATTKHDADGIHHSYFSEGREACRLGPLGALDGQERTMLENELGRHLTRVGLAASLYISRFVCSQWFCRVCSFHHDVARSHSPAIGLGQAVIRILQLSGILATEDQKVCIPVYSISQSIANMFTL